MIRLLDEHALTSPGLTGEWEHRLGKIERGEDSRERFMSDIAGFAKETVHELDEKLKDVRIPRAKLGPCPVCGHEIVENRKGYSCWSREDPGCGFVIWKAKAGKQLPVAVARELIKTGYTARPVTGFRGRSGRSFRARLALEPDRGGQMARGVRRGLGPGGRQAARSRGRDASEPCRRAAPPRRACRRRRAPSQPADRAPLGASGAAGASGGCATIGVHGAHARHRARQRRQGRARARRRAP